MRGSESLLVQSFKERCLLSSILFKTPATGSNLGCGRKSFFGPLRVLCVRRGHNRSRAAVVCVFLQRTLEQQVDYGVAARYTGSLKSAEVTEAQLQPLGSTERRTLTELCRQKRFPAAWITYQEMRAKQTPLSYTERHMLLSCASSVGELEKALQVLRDMQGDGFQTNFKTYTGLISALGKSRRKGAPYRGQAYSLWQELKAMGLELDAEAYRAGLNACVNFGRLSEAKTLLDDLTASGIAEVRAYNIMLKGYSRAGQLQNLRKLLDTMHARGVEPSAATCNTVIDAYVRNGQLSTAIVYLQEALESGKRPDSVTYGPLVRGYAEMGDLEAACRVVNLMVGAGIQPTEVTYATLINGCIEKQDLQTAGVVLAEMVSRGIQLNVVIYNTILKAVSRAKGRTSPYKDTSEVLETMAQRGVQPQVDTFNTLMSIALENKDWWTVDRLFTQLKSLGHVPDSVSYASLISACGRLSRLEQAVEAFTELDSRPDNCVDIPVLNALAVALAMNARVEAAKQYVQRAEDMCVLQGDFPLPEARLWLLITLDVCHLRHLSRLDLLGSIKRVFIEWQLWQLATYMTSASPLLFVQLCVKTGEFKRALQACLADATNKMALLHKQVVRAMEQGDGKLGMESKQKIKNLLREFISKENQLRAAMPRQRNISLERFKFWLGMKNLYYGADD